MITYLFLVDTSMFVDKNATYVDVVYLKYFIGLKAIHEYNWGTACLIYMYLKLDEGCLWKKISNRKLHATYGNLLLLLFHNSFVTLVTNILSEPFLGWIITHFLRISGWELVPNYTDDWPRAATFALRGNQAIESFQVYLDRHVTDDIALCPYDGHCETRQVDIFSLYSGWLTCGLALMYVYLPERVMHQFRYL